MGLKPAALYRQGQVQTAWRTVWGESMARQLITVEGVDRSFGPVDVLQDVNLVVNHGERIGIVGHNGAGKTTLLNTISDQKQDVGDVDFAPGLRIAYLTQIRDLESDRTIEEELSRKGRQFQELEEEIAAIDKGQAEATKIRTEENADNTKAMKEFKESADAVIRA
ncbi:MAG: ATP-binding cassette domain-containing protein, partial [Candidatus Thermoplasmatota archaeon]|nr:ATP-binding cassette domain-containing protein [Candidatus Thermoplasmatota archaeon]